MLDVTESMTLLLADFVTLRSDWRNILRERDLAGRVNVLRRVGNGPGHRRPRRYYGRHAARRHGDTKFVGVGRLWTFEIKFAVTGAATALRVVAFLQDLTNNRRPDGAFVVSCWQEGCASNDQSHTPTLPKPCRRDAMLSIRR